MSEPGCAEASVPKYVRPGSNKAIFDCSDYMFSIFSMRSMLLTGDAFNTLGAQHLDQVEDGESVCLLHQQLLQTKLSCGSWIGSYL